MKEIKYEEHTFGPSETVVAILKKLNRMDLDFVQINKLLVLYNKLNGPDVQKPGNTVKIPILYKSEESQ